MSRLLTIGNSGLQNLVKNKRNFSSDEKKTNLGDFFSHIKLFLVVLPGRTLITLATKQKDYKYTANNVFGLMGPSCALFFS